mgnify:CR=1 FL=1
MASMGHQSQLAIADDGTAIGSFTIAYEFQSESLRKTGEIINPNGIRGTRQQPQERTRFGPYAVGGDIVMHPSPADLDNLLPYIQGAAEIIDVFNPGESLDAFEMAILVDRIAQRHLYDDCKVGRATWRSTAGPGSLVEMTLGLVGKNETVSATAFPAITPPTDAHDAPYVFSDGVFTFVSGARDVIDFEVTIDNVLATRFTNSTTATDISATDRIVTVRVTTPYTSGETALYGQALAGTAGTIVFTNGGLSTTFTFATLQVADVSPVVGSKGEIVYAIDMVARKSGATNDLVITNDSVA